MWCGVCGTTLPSFPSHSRAGYGGTAQHSTAQHSTAEDRQHSIPEHSTGEGREGEQAGGSINGRRRQRYYQTV